MSKPNADIDVPLEFVGRLPGENGTGPSVVHVVPHSDGRVLANRMGRLSSMSLDLMREDWGVAVHGWASRPIVTGQSAWSSLGNDLLEWDLDRGVLSELVHLDEKASLRAVSGDHLLLWRPTRHLIIEASGRPSGSRAGRSSHIRAIPDGFLITEHFDQRVTAIDFAGDERWHFELPNTSAETLPSPTRFPAGFPAVNVFNSDVVLVTGDMRVVCLDLADGRVKRSGKVAASGAFDVTATTVHVLGPTELVEFSHGTMLETARQQHPEEWATVWRGRDPAFLGLRVTPSSILVSTLYSVWMGASRLRHGKRHRAVWSHEEPGHIASIGEAPLVHEGFAYFETRGIPADRNGVLVFKGRS